MYVLELNVGCQHGCSGTGTLHILSKLSQKLQLQKGGRLGCEICGIKRSQNIIILYKDNTNNIDM